MLFISYWELNPDFDPSELGDLATTLLKKKLYPAEGVNQIAWYISATDYWGISVSEAENDEALMRDTQMWRIAMPGLFKSIKTTPAMDIVKMLPMIAKLAKEVKE
jgi:hypothetical protein